MRNTLYIAFILTSLLVVGFYISKTESLYTELQIESLKKGDTIYFKEFRTIDKFVVINNIKDKKLLEIKNIKYEYYNKTQIEEYKNIQFQD